jgi:uncharacterized protein YndB with AHSA1/START domain
VFEAWTTPELFKQWWVPKSSGATLLSCEQDVRVGGSYRLEFAHPKAATPMAFFGRYLEVVPNARLVWTNEESADGAVTTVTFEEKDGKTLLVMRELYPSKQALDTPSREWTRRCRDVRAAGRIPRRPRRRRGTDLNSLLRHLPSSTREAAGP